MNEDRLRNLEKLEQIAALEDGWNGNGAKAFDSKLISKVRELIHELERQPEVFPTALDSIQLEFTKTDDSYLEFEIGLGDTCKVFQISSIRQEREYSIPEDLNVITKIVDNFFAAS